jgi:hypothetical protein
MKRAIASKRHGGVLLPVIILAGILFFLSALLPQVLIQASHALVSGFDRQSLLYAAESGLSFGEAKLKQELSDAVMLGSPLPTPGWTFSPYSTNPDYGPSQPLTFKVTVMAIKAKDVVIDNDQERDRFSYRLDCSASDRKNHTLDEQETGLITVTIPAGSGGSGLKAVSDVSIQAGVTPLTNP